ncbi:Guanine nucleotide-binding protein, beta subunit [Trema orientale]|uniref:Guanine nucleotide-binding protein, beta subunit n=1 Tax=Trema orientale TaxID=63057 RepID=A0A2P5C1V1_TREOI|nr:Guanine nucleotide-binding protein, beta subunit [Trema orientale]
MSSSSSSDSSSSSSYQGRGNDNGNAGGTSSAAAGTSSGSGTMRRGSTDYGEPSPSRQRGPNYSSLPEHIIEALATHVAIEAARTFGRLAAAPALAHVFQVCRHWRLVSRSDLLWHRITRRIWGRAHLRHDTWRDEYIYWHQTTLNFRGPRYNHAVLHFDPDPDAAADAAPNALACRCLTLSDDHLACGFADATVRLFHLPTRRHVSTFRPDPRPVLGPFSRAVTGIFITNDHRVVFATLDGDVHVAVINEPPRPRRVHVGHVVDDGVLVDFAGCGRWWVGLYAGVPGRAFHIWDGNTEELVFVGGSLTDPESVTGWQMLIELNLVVGRIRVTSQESAVACTSSRAMVFDLRNQGLVLGEEEYDLMVTSMDVSNSAYIIVDRRGIARVRRADTLEEVCSFRVRRGAWQRGVMGCMNRGYALMCAGGVIRVWEVESGRYLYRLNEEVGDPVSAFVADERHVVACSNDATLHLWDFGAQ